MAQYPLLNVFLMLMFTPSIHFAEVNPETLDPLIKKTYSGCIPPELTKECLSRSEDEITTQDHTVPTIDPTNTTYRSSRSLTVGIIGGGISGLYSGLLLKQQGINFHIFESNDRVGGRIHTYYFNNKKNQYFETGAFRLQVLAVTKPMFDLFEYLNEKNANYKIVTIDYAYRTDNNFVYFNGKRNASTGRPFTRAEYFKKPSLLGFNLGKENSDKSAEKLYDEALGEYVDLVTRKGPKCLLNCDQFTVRDFLITEKGWSDDKLNYVEAVTSGTNYFQYGFIHNILDSSFYDVKHFKTIQDGMSRFPEACRKVIGDNHISLESKVFKITKKRGKIIIHYHQKGSEHTKEFDRVILALPPREIRKLTHPRFSDEKERAFRTINLIPAYKIGLRFKSRFWEKTEQPSFGGQAVTDLPTRWFVYPSYGLGDSGPGVLFGYSWGDDAAKWIGESDKQKEEFALRDLAVLYGDKIVKDEFIESKPIDLWFAYAFSSFYPGDYKYHLGSATAPEMGFYFTGEQYNEYGPFIIGAMRSALEACRMLLGDPDLDFLRSKN